jgi:hypothetical protein
MPADLVSQLLDAGMFIAGAVLSGHICRRFYDMAHKERMAQVQVAAEREAELRRQLIVMDERLDKCHRKIWDLARQTGQPDLPFDS